jgi:hypothetical protein
MPPRTATTPARRPRITGLVRAARRKLSDRIHAAADDQARALGWEVAEIPGWFGLRGRSYHDPRFALRQLHQQDAQAGSDERYGWPAFRRGG